MMKTHKLFCLFVASLLLLASCGNMDQMVESAKGAMPKFKGGTPNLMTGTWVTKSSSVDGGYVYRLTLKPDKTYTLEGSDNQSVEGSYTYSYDHLDLLEASGKLTFSEGFPPNNQREQVFSFYADESAGPRKLVLSGVAYQFLTR